MTLAVAHHNSLQRLLKKVDRMTEDETRFHTIVEQNQTVLSLQIKNKMVLFANPSTLRL